MKKARLGLNNKLGCQSPRPPAPCARRFLCLLYSQVIVYKEIGDKKHAPQDDYDFKDHHRTLLCAHAHTSER